MVTEPVDRMYAILMEELEAFRPKRFRDRLIVTKIATTWAASS